MPAIWRVRASPCRRRFPREPAGNEAAVAPGSVNLVDGRGAERGDRTGSGRKLVLEDLDLTAREDASLEGWAAHVARTVHPGDAESQSDVIHRFALLPDTIMDFLAETATEIRARIAIDPKSGTVKTGALWYEENLPAEAVLWGVFALSASNSPDDPRPEEELAGAMPDSGTLLQLGGKAGVGPRAGALPDRTWARAIRGPRRRGGSGGGDDMIPVRTHAVAVAAYERVDARRDEPWKKQYGALAHKLPGMILQNGLAQATGFLLAKGKSEHLALLGDLNAVLIAADAVPKTTANGPALHDLIIRSGLTDTMKPHPPIPGSERLDQALRAGRVAGGCDRR